MNNTIFDASQAFGWHLFPLLSGQKVPTGIIASHSQDCTDRRDQWEYWAAANPGCNFGVEAGPSGLIVVDIDVKNLGTGPAWQQWINFCAQWGTEPYQPTVNTPSGGWHIYFSLPVEISRTLSQPDLAQDVNIRAGNGFVVVPGSQVGGKPYAFTGHPVYNAPAWLIEHCQNGIVGGDPAPIHDSQTRYMAKPDTERTVSKARSYLERIGPAVQGAGGDLRTYQVCNMLKDFGLSRKAAFEMLAEDGGWNSRCSPPWNLGWTGPNALGVKLASAYRSTQTVAGCKSPELTVMRMVGKQELISQLQANPPMISEWVEGGATPQTVRLVQFVEAAIEQLKPPPDPTPVDFSRIKKLPLLVEGLAYAGGACLVSGAPGAYKTTMITSLLASTLCDNVDHVNIGIQDNCYLVLSYEGGEQVASSVEATIRHLGMQVKPGRENHVVVLNENLPSLNHQSGHLLLPVNDAGFIWIAEQIDKIKADTGKPCVLVIDTLGAAASGIENNEAMQNVCIALKKLARKTQSGVLIVHHPGKNPQENKVFGASSLLRILDAVAVAEFDEIAQHTEITFQKNRFAPKTKRLYYISKIVSPAPGWAPEQLRNSHAPGVRDMQHKDARVPIIIEVGRLKDEKEAQKVKIPAQVMAKTNVIMHTQFGKKALPHIPTDDGAPS